MIFNELKNASINTNKLESFIESNYTDLYDFFTFHNNELTNLRQEFRQYVLFNINVLEKLNTGKQNNLNYLTLLLSVCERQGLLMPFRRLFTILKGQEYNIGYRLNAASLYLIGINSAQDYLGRYDSIIDELNKALEYEEDNENGVIITLINYYSQVLNNFGEFNYGVVTELRNKINQSRVITPNSFLTHSVITDILKIPITPFQDAYSSIQNRLDLFLKEQVARKYLDVGYIIEEDTEYANRLFEIPDSVLAIRELASNYYKSVQNEETRRSLQRGVAILEEEKQLNAYQYSYGKMHYFKMLKACENLPNNLFEHDIQIVDWGCGQGVATMVYLEYINSNQKNKNITKINLIEPSEIALKRAALHIKKMGPNIPVRTINKDLDSLELFDFNRGADQSATVHLFSNILDVELFSMSELLKKIKGAFKGVNYFICVSPYINDLRTSRVDIFVNHFSNNPNFEIYLRTNEQRGEWINNWTRVVRIFKAEIN